MKKITLTILALLILNQTFSQNRSNLESKKSHTYIDSKGIMRWSGTEKEVAVFGTNYMVPFSYWEARKEVKTNLFKAIDEDVYHISRLGIDGYRVPVWDCHISDHEGNLVENEHLKLYDYLQYKLKQRGIKMYITPMILFTDSDKGFAHKYGGKNGLLSKKELFPMMAKYLEQFVNHVNPYTGIAYKDDPDILAFEIINEPSHWAAPELVEEFIDMMYSKIRATGCSKPLFYNMTTAKDYVDSILKTDVEGGSFQWYPTGLTSNFDLKANYLPFVDKYDIPFDNELKNKKMVKFGYEFCPSDVGDSGAMYAAMARSFREAGFQFTAQFGYDPMYVAYSNIDFKTHFLNMAYTPEKSIGMMIGSEVFHQMPLYKLSGRYPDNNKFGSTTIFPSNQLAIFNDDTKFIYTKSNDIAPLNSSSLKKVAGTGSSKVVKYSGTGLYILDQIESGVWRLEVMPDAFWVRDPFFTATNNKEVAVTVSRKQQMEIELSDLGEKFTVMGLNSGNSTSINASSGKFSITPGAYLLTKEGVITDYNAASEWNNISLGEYYMPEREMNANYVLNSTPTEISVGNSSEIAVKVITKEKPESVELLVVSQSGGTEKIEMNSTSEYDYVALLPEKYTSESQIVSYHINVKSKDGYRLFPYNNLGATSSPSKVYEDDIKIDESSYQLSVVPSNNPIYLLLPNRDWDTIIKKHRKDKLVYSPTAISGQKDVQFSSQSKFGDNAIELWCADAINSRVDDLKQMKNIEINGSLISSKNGKLKVTLAMRDGSTYGANIDITDKLSIYTIPLSTLKQTEYMMQPLAYPTFRSESYKMPKMSSFDIREVEKIQVSIIPTVNSSSHADSVSLNWIRLNR